MPIFCHYFATMRLPGQMRQLLAWSIQAPRVAKLQQITSQPLSYNLCRRKLFRWGLHCLGERAEAATQVHLPVQGQSALERLRIAWQSSVASGVTVCFLRRRYLAAPRANVSWPRRVRTARDKCTATEQAPAAAMESTAQGAMAGKG